jgi:hypothetical protein
MADVPRWVSPLIAASVLFGFAAIAVCTHKKENRQGYHRQVLNEFLATVRNDQTFVGTDPVPSTKSAVALLAAAKESHERYSTSAIFVGGDAISCFELEIPTSTGTRTVVVSVREADKKLPTISRVALEPPCRCKKNSDAECD